MKADKVQVIEKIEGFFRSIKEVSAVYLFGSYASGSERPNSDIDLGILFDSNDLKFIRHQVESYNNALARLLRKDIHLTVLNSASQLLMKQIFSKGRCILINNPKKLSLFKMTEFAKIADFGIYKSNFERNFVHKIING